ncbi:MAG: hypothetical protein ACE5JX_00595 [Acidobacteriota bacterium]
MEFVKLIVTRLESEGISYMLTGSMAMAVYSMPRMTRDVDLVVECGPEDAGRIVKLFATDCYVDAQSVREAVARQHMFNMIHQKWIIKADFIIRKDEVYRKLEFERRRRVDLEDVSISVVAPEDLILSKLCWARDSQSELQESDARRLIESVVDLDWPYLERWAESLGIRDLLDRVRTG